MSRLHRAGLFLWNFLTDYRNGLTLLASAVVALLFITVISSIDRTDEAIDHERTAIERYNSAVEDAETRIDRLNGQIERLAAQILANNQRSAQERGALLAAVFALQGQVEELGGRPAFQLRPSSTTTTSRPRSTTTTRPRPTTTTTQPPPSTTTTSTTRCRLTIRGTCVA